MKNLLPDFAKPLVLFAALMSALYPAGAQPGGGNMGPQFSGALTKLFGDNKAFSASVELQTDGGPSGQQMTMASSMALLDGMIRFEMDMSQMHGPNIPPQAIAQMKQMGMDKVVTISVPDKKVARIIYPGIKSYAEMPIAESETTKAADFKMEIKELGSETVQGHDCVKNKVIVTGADGAPHESMVWNAKDLNKFPVKIQMTDKGNQITMIFKDVKLDKPDAALFIPSPDYKKYDSVMSMMMSRMSGAPSSP